MVTHKTAIVHTGAGNRTCRKGIFHCFPMLRQGIHAITHTAQLRKAAACLLLSMGRAGEEGIHRFQMFFLEIVFPAAGTRIHILPKGQPVADGCACAFLVCPVFARRFQHVQLPAVHQQEGIVVVKVMVKAAVAALSVGFQQRNQIIQRFSGTSAPLQRKTHHVHTGQTRFSVGAFGKHRLIADAESPLVHTHLRAPHPDRS